MEPKYHIDGTEEFGYITINRFLYSFYMYMNTVKRLTSLYNYANVQFLKGYVAHFCYLRLMSFDTLIKVVLNNKDYLSANCILRMLGDSVAVFRLIYMEPDKYLLVLRHSLYVIDGCERNLEVFPENNVNEGCLSDEELSALIAPNIKQINELSTKKDVMLKTLGIVEGKPDYLYSGFQKSVKLYPELLSDSYCRKTIKDLKRKLESEMYSGKFMINGKYTFVVPDLHAFCEWLFLGIEVPQGILKDGEVCCKLFKNGERLDCLRSPHLYCEHPVRVNRTDIEEFATNAVYVSSHDFISRIIQNDWDGDTILISNNKILIRSAERNMQGRVPLYYIMKKAKVEIVTPDSLWRGLTLAFTGGNIGEISNSITKIWNSGEITPEKEKYVKYLCMLTNFTID